MGARRARFEELVEAIAVAEGVTGNPLDMEIVRDFAGLVVQTDQARDWLFQHGLVTAEGWRAVPRRDVDGSDWLVENDVNGEPIRSPVVPEHLVDGLRVLTRLKAQLHERLRAGTGKRGDGGALSLAEQSRDALRRLFPTHSPVPPGGDA